MKATRLLFLTAAAALFGAAPAFADIIVGMPADVGQGNEFPFGDAYNTEYQQEYASSAFSGPITITDLEFFNTQFDSAATSTPSGNFTISLSYGPTSLAPGFASNIGADDTVVFSGSLSQSWAFGDTLQINLTTPFNYIPADGNLLLDVVGTGISLPGGSIFFDVNSTSNELSRDYCLSAVPCSTGTTQDNYGLVTGFSTGEATSVPEPGSLILFASGLLALAGAFRGRFRSPARTL